MIDITKFEDLTVLVLDDEAILLKVVETTFRKQPYDVITAETPEEAFSILEEKDIAVVISDYKMPKMQGVEFLEQVKESHPDIIRILMTAYADLGVSVEAINRVGVFRFILKPWEQIEFQNTIESALQYYTVHREKEQAERQLESYLRMTQNPPENFGDQDPVSGEPIVIQASNTSAQKHTVEENSDSSLANLLVEAISQPLEKVLGNLDVLYARPNLTDQDKALLLEVKPWLHTIDSLAKGILLNTNGNGSKKSQVNLIEAVRQALGTGQVLINSKSIEIIEEYPETTPVIKASEAQIEKVLVTVFQNVLGMIQPGSLLTCRISNSADNSKKKNNQWEIVIESSGGATKGNSGQIPEHPYQAWIVPFTQAGWEISRSIVEQHAGQFDVTGNGQNELNLQIVLPANG